MDAARPREPGDVEAVAPAVGDLCPLGRPAAVAERLAGVDRDAVDDSGRERVELAARRGGGRLVEDGQAALRVARPDPDRALEHERGRLEATVAEPLAELARLPERLPGALELAQVDGRGPAHESEMPVLDAFGLVGEQPLAPRDPAGRHRERPAQAVVHRERHRDHRRAPGLACLHERGVRALAEPDRLLEAPGPPGGVAEAREVVGRERTALVRASEQVVRVAPGMPPSGVPAGFERVVHDLGHGY